MKTLFAIVTLLVVSLPVSSFANPPRGGGRGGERGGYRGGEHFERGGYRGPVIVGGLYPAYPYYPGYYETTASCSSKGAAALGDEINILVSENPNNNCLVTLKNDIKVALQKKSANGRNKEIRAIFGLSRKDVRKNPSLILNAYQERIQSCGISAEAAKISTNRIVAQFNQQ